MTQAQILGEILGMDGMRLETSDGRTLDEIARGHGARAFQGEGQHYDSTRYEFPDGSAVVVAHGAAWDFAADCICGFCWEETGHECEATARDLFALRVRWERDGVACFSDDEPGGPLYVASEALDEALLATEDPDEIAEMYARWCRDWDVSHEPPVTDEEPFAELDLGGPLAPRVRFTLAGSNRADELADAAGYGVDWSSQVETSSTWEGERVYAAPLVERDPNDDA